MYYSYKVYINKKVSIDINMSLYTGKINYSYNYYKYRTA